MRKPTLTKVLLRIVVKLAIVGVLGAGFVHLMALLTLETTLVAAILVTYGLPVYAAFTIYTELARYRRFRMGPPN